MSPPAKRVVHTASIAAAGRLTAPRADAASFLIVGAQRCGTTSMYRALSQHPAILKPVLHKGVHYFDINYGQRPGLVPRRTSRCAHGATRASGDRRAGA